MVIYKYY